jgi:hypothetical protein
MICTSMLAHLRTWYLRYCPGAFCHRASEWLKHKVQNVFQVAGEIQSDSGHRHLPYRYRGWRVNQSAAPWSSDCHIDSSLPISNIGFDTGTHRYTASMGFMRSAARRATSSSAQVEICIAEFSSLIRNRGCNRRVSDVLRTRTRL